LVDLDGTLYYPAPVKMLMAAELLLFGLPSIGTIRAFRKEHERDEGTPAMDGNSFELQVSRAAQLTERSPDEVRRVVDRWMFQRPLKWISLFRRRSLLQELRNFKARGGKLALVSDYPAQAKLSALPISFDVVVASGELEGPSRKKPDPEGYLKAASLLGAQPEECVIIGDRPDRDGEAAARAGIRYVQVG
jgi:HAD superfamily hydrolase (TIGR01509 family)